MSFTDADKENIRRWLGYTADAASMGLIGDRCALAAAAAPGVVQTVQGFLRELGRVDQEMKATRPFMDRTLTSNASGTTQRSPSFGRDYRHEEVRRLVNEVSTALQIPVKRYPMSGASGWSSQGRVVRG